LTALPEFPVCVIIQAVDEPNSEEIAEHAGEFRGMLASAPPATDLILVKPKANKSYIYQTLVETYQATFGK
jgi:hypothetical protein